MMARPFSISLALINLGTIVVCVASFGVRLPSSSSSSPFSSPRPHHSPSIYRTPLCSPSYARSSSVANAGGSTGIGSDDRRGDGRLQYDGFLPKQHYLGGTFKSATELGMSASTDVGIGSGGGGNDDDSPSLQQQQQQQLIESWLSTHLPALPPSDLQSYTTYLCNDGFASLEELNSINTGSSGRVEDLYFMKKGHRRVLMKKIGIVRTMRGIEGNRLVRDHYDDDKKDEESTAAPSSSSPAAAPDKASITPQQNQLENERVYDNSIEDWLVEQNRQVEARRLARLADEEKRKNNLASATSEPSLAPEPEEEESPRQQQQLRGEEVDEAKKNPEEAAGSDGDRMAPGGGGDEDLLEDEIALRIQSLCGNIEDRYGTARNEARRLEELKREFFERVQAREARRGSEAAAANAGGENAEEDEDEMDLLLDDFAMRYRSLDLASRGDEGKTDKEARRLEEVKQSFQRAKAGDGSGDGAENEADVYQSMLDDYLSRDDDMDLLDDFEARYQSLDMASRGEGGTKGKEARRLEDLKRLVVQSAKSSGANSNYWGEGQDADEAMLDDFVSKFDALKEVSTDRDGTASKEARRLNELKQEFRNAQKTSTKPYEDEEPLRLDLMQPITKEETAVERKERLRVKEFQRLAAKKQEGENTSSSEGNIKKTCKSNEARRLEELERYFNKRRAGRISKDEKLEQLLSEAWARKGEDSKTEGEGNIRNRLQGGEISAEDDMKLDDFFERRTAEGQSLSNNIGEVGGYKTNEARRLEELERYFKKRRAFSIAREERLEQMMTDAKEALMKEDGNTELEDKREESDSASESTVDRDVKLENLPEERAAEAKSLPATVPPTTIGQRGQDKDRAAETNLDDFTDITVNNVKERENLSLSTTMPPSNRGAVIRQPSYTEDRQVMDDPEECIDEECWDITRSSFAERKSQSLATTLAPINTKKEASSLPVNTTSANGGSKKTSNSASKKVQNDDDYFYDITQNLFPESNRGPNSSARTPQSAFKQSDKSEMNARRPPRKKDAEECIDEECWDITRSDFAERSSQSLSTTLPPINTIEETFSAVATPNMDGRDEKASIQASDKGQDDDELFYDITQNLFPDGPDRGDRRSMTAPSAFEKGRTSENEDNQSEVAGGKPPDPTITKAEMNANAPGVSKDQNKSELTSRASLLYQKFRSKRRKSSAFKESEKSEMNSRPPPTVSSRSAPKWVQKIDPATSMAEGKTSSKGSIKNRSTPSVQNFLPDRAVFSPDRASLLGHQTRTQIDSRSQSSSNYYLDKHRFSSKLGPSSPATAAASTSALWRYSSAKKDEEFLDTPRAFANNLDMMPSSMNRDASKKRIGVDSPKKNPFSSSLRSSATIKGSTSQKMNALLDDHQPFLDTPRAFQSNVDMVSSNTSGARFKRSSDVPLEEKNTKDYFDITTAPMPDINRMAKTKMSRKESPPTSEETVSNEESMFTDITRMPMSTLDRTSSVVKDANNAFKVRSKNASNNDSDEAAAMNRVSNDIGGASDQSEESSYEEVMHWLLTHIPQLEQEDAIAYFNRLLDDGFDSMDNLLELIEEDLQFMKEDHQRAMLQSLRIVVGDTDGDAEAAVLQVREENVAASQNSSASGPLTVDPQDEPFEDITRSNFVDRPSISLDSPHTSSLTSKNRNRARADEEEEVFDITRSKFTDRQSFASAPSSLEILASTPQRQTRKKTSNAFSWITEANGRINERAAAQKENFTAKVKEGDAQSEPFQDITRSKFVDRPSLSLAAPASSVTRNSFPDRQTSQTLASHLPPTSRERIKETSSPTSNSLTYSPRPATEAAPRAELHQWYTKNKGLASEQARRLKEYFTTWSDDTKSHQAKFTCVFTCPMTGEHFACGSWRDGGEAVEVKDEVFWYKTKKQAMSAAAAKALDCFSFRECHGSGTTPLQRCEDAPYLSLGDALSLPTLPVGISLPSKLVQPEGLTPNTEG